MDNLARKLGGLPERKFIERRFEDCYQVYENWRPRWKEICSYIAPYRGAFDDDEPNRGERRDGQIINETAVDANGILAAGMQSGMTSLSRPWFRLGLLDPELSEYAPVRRFLDKCAEQILGIYARTNIYECTHNVYEELGGPGTGAMAILDDFENVMRGTSFTIGEYAVACGPDGRVNTFARKRLMTVYDMVKEFGLDMVSDAVRNCYKDSKLGERFMVYHLIEPNDERIPDMVDALNKPFRSVYWEPAVKDRYLAVRGFEEFPIMVPRWQVFRSADYYGRGPGWKALPGVKQLQVMEKDKLLTIKLANRPPIKAPSSAKATLISLLPGSITFADDNGGNGVTPMFQVNQNIQHLAAEIDRVEQRVRRAFYADLFLMMVESDRREITAREVAERHEEKLLIIGPTLERLQNDFYDPMIARSFAILQRANLLPEIPRELHGKVIKVDYISILAQAQKMVATNTIAQAVAFATQVATAQPDVLDVLDLDQAVRKYSEAVGLSPEIVRSIEDVRKIRAAREQALQQQQMMASAAAAADAAKNLSQADMSRSNALTVLMGGAA